MAKRIRAHARIVPDGRAFTVSGQEARTLLLLVEKGQKGVVVFDFPGGPAFRLAAYTHNLIRRHGLVIETRREKHEGGWHGRFVLHTAVEILQQSDRLKMAEAA